MPKQILPKRQLYFTKDSKPYFKPKSIKEILLKDFKKVFIVRKKIIILSGAGISVAAKIPNFHTLYRRQSRHSPFKISNYDNDDFTKNMHSNVCIINEKASHIVLTNSY
ncbi:hypothetical protein V2W45_1329020 [Cenococcum geophilum]